MLQETQIAKNRTHQTNMLARAVTGQTIDLTQVQEQIVRYATWLAAQSHLAQRGDTLQEINAYIDHATKQVEINGQHIQTFAPFRYKYSALRTVTGKQIVTLCILAASLLGILLWQPTLTLSIAFTIISIFYMLHLILDFALALGTLRHNPEEQVDETILQALKDADWPTYTILCPLYKEVSIVPQFVKAMKDLDYPTQQLQILFLTEEDDLETRQAILALHLPAHFTVVTVPAGSPRTKPRACNYGLLEANGQYVVIYDAEDKPDTLQLKKAVLTFAKHGPQVACVQAKLNFYNPDQNILTRWFTAEYSLWFDLILPGLQQAGFMLPLGGTSNHFPTQVIRALGGWDAFNVTEDCDLGLRLSWFRLDTVVLNSTTYEEANSQFKNWIRQRSRWIKGYMQTYLVHMREPWHYLRHRRYREFISLQLIIGGKSAVLFINPLLWLFLLSALLLRPIAGPFYSHIFPPPVLLISLICLILGNFFYGYVYLIACMRRQHYALVKWTLLVPLYWIMGSIAATMALIQLITKPHYWEKTVHGLHLTQHTEDDETETAVTWQDAATLVAEVLPDEQFTLERQAHILAASKQHVALQMLTFPSVQAAIEGMITQPLPAFSPLERASLLSHKRPPYYPWLISLLFIATFTSLLSNWYALHQHLILINTNARMNLALSHALLTGFGSFMQSAQHSTWLPLQALLAFPLIWNATLWHNGLAGSLPSTLSYIVATAYLFLIGYEISKDSRASFIGTLIFVSNPSVLALQSTPDNTLLTLTTTTISIYYFLRWSQHEHLKDLVLAAICVCLATLASYEAWGLVPLLLLIISLIQLMQHRSWARIESNLLIFLLPAGFGIFLWSITCSMAYGSPFPLIVTLTALYTTPLALLAHTFTALTDTLLRTEGQLTLALACVATAVFLLNTRSSTKIALLPLLLLPLFTFFTGIMFLTSLSPILPVMQMIAFSALMVTFLLGRGLLHNHSQVLGVTIHVACAIYMLVQLILLFSTGS